MPFIKAKVNVPVTFQQEREIKSLLGRAVESVPGKSEKYLMIIFEENCRIWLRGNDTESAAYIEVSIYGNESHYEYNGLTIGITEAFSKILGIPPGNIYVKYDDIQIWSVNGITIA